MCVQTNIASSASRAAVGRTAPYDPPPLGTLTATTIETAIQVQMLSNSFGTQRLSYDLVAAVEYSSPVGHDLDRHFQ